MRFRLLVGAVSGIPAAGTSGSLAGGGVARAHVGPGQTLTVPGQAAGSVTVYAAGASSPELSGLPWTAHQGDRI